MPIPEQLRRGYASFVTTKLRDEQDRFVELSERGQAPKILVISCCDSRVPPEVIFSAGPGELFVIRNVANLVPPYDPVGGYHGTSAALEYAVQVLKVESIVLLGHAQCGGIRAFAEGARQPLSPGDFIGKWMSLLQTAADGVSDDHEDKLDEYSHVLELASLKQGLTNLRTFPCIRHRESKARLKLHALYFTIATGSLSVLDEDGEFKPVVA